MRPGGTPAPPTVPQPPGVMPAVTPFPSPPQYAGACHDATGVDVGATNSAPATGGDSSGNPSPARLMPYPPELPLAQSFPLISVAFFQAPNAAVLVFGVLRFNEVDINAFHM